MQLQPITMTILHHYFGLLLLVSGASLGAFPQGPYAHWEERLNILARAIIEEQYSLGIYGSELVYSKRFPGKLENQFALYPHKREALKSREEQSEVWNHIQAYQIRSTVRLQTIKGTPPEVLFYQMDRHDYALGRDTTRAFLPLQALGGAQYLLVLESPYDDEGNLIEGKFFDEPGFREESFYGPHNFYSVVDQGLGAFCLQWIQDKQWAEMRARAKPALIVTPAFADDVKALVALWEGSGLPTDPVALEARLAAVVAGLHTDYGRQLAERVLALGWPEVEGWKRIIQPLINTDEH